MKKQLILASASPRRKELLDQIGVRYIVHPVDIDETPNQAEVAKDYVIRVAAEKSKTCFDAVDSSLPVLAADTSVVIDGQVLGKPKNEAHAKEMMQLLSGRTHIVYSAVSLRSSDRKPETRHFQALSLTEVSFRKITSTEIEGYWQTGEPQGKAGGYAIQGLASIFVQSINGSFSGVVGLPLFETAALLSKQGIKISNE
ncbi:MAG: Maf family nucleotide pyrophosphatase [Methylococcaceae bacterium]|nr:Maf family nucleotide pyrophosphatase [Methylococcaceae bacterium]